MSRAHVNSKIQVLNSVVSVDDATILLDHCMATDFVSTRGQYALASGNVVYPSRGNPYRVTPLGVTIGSSPSGPAYNFSYASSGNNDGGLAYSLLSTPKTIFCRFKFLDTDISRDKPILCLYDTTASFLSLYTQVTSGQLRLQIYDSVGTTYSASNPAPTSYYADIPTSIVNVVDGNWHTVAIIVNTTYTKINGSDARSGYVCKLIIDGKYTAQTVALGDGVPMLIPLILPSTICLGFDKNGSVGNISICEIRCDMVEYTEEDILGWTIYNKQFYDPYDYNAYVY